MFRWVGGSSQCLQVSWRHTRASKGGGAKHKGCEVTGHVLLLDLRPIHLPTLTQSPELEMISNTIEM